MLKKCRCGFKSAAVVIPLHQGIIWIANALNSLRTHCRRCLIFLVDNGGQDSESVASIGEPGVVNVLTAPRTLPFAEVNNLALLNGCLNVAYVCFLNQDTISRSPWLDACVECLERRPEVGAVMPLITNYDGTAWDEAFFTCAKASPELVARLQEGVSAELRDLPDFIPVPEITAAAMVVRREALLQAGPFDPIYGSYYEDYDLCRRIARAGYAVGICTRGYVGHYGGSATNDRGAFYRRARWIARNRVIYAARWKWRSRPVGLLRYLTMEMPWNFARSALGRSNIPLSAFVKAQLDLLKLLPRLVSRRLDEYLWQKYLRSLPWPQA